MGNIYKGVGYGGSSDQYKGVLWDADESPLLKESDMSDGIKSGDIRVIKVQVLKSKLESDILKMISDFEGVTALSVRHVDIIRATEIGDRRGRIAGVEIEVVI